MELDSQAGSYQELCRSFRWQIPEQFNLAVDICGRWAEQRHRFALYYEDESGFTSAHTFWDIQRQANRLSNVLAALGTLPGDRVAIVLPQCPEAAIAQIAICQMGALAVPLSPFLGPDPLEYRLGDAAAHLAIVDATTQPGVLGLRHRLPLLRHVLGVGSAAAPGVRPWDEVLEHASARYTPTVTAAGDPAMILYRGGGTRGALMAHRMLFGKLSAFVCAHDFFPQPRDMLWSPGESAWAGGFWDALLPTWHFGMPLLAYNGRLDAAKVFALIEKYGIRNAVLWPTLLQRMMQQVAEPGAVYDLDLRTLASVGEPVDQALWRWARDKMGVAINGVFGPAGLPDLVGNWASRWPASPGAVGRAYPGHRVAVIDAQGNALPPGEVGELAVFRQYHAEDDPLPMLGYWRDPEATAEAVVGDGWVRTGESATLDGEGNLFCQQPTDDTFASAGTRVDPSEIETCLRTHADVANCAVIGSADELGVTRPSAFVVLRPGVLGTPELVRELQRHVGRYLAPYETPKAIEFTAALPLGAGGEVLRRALSTREA